MWTRLSYNYEIYNDRTVNAIRLFHNTTLTLFLLTNVIHSHTSDTN